MSISEEEGYARIGSALANISYDPMGVAKGAARALREYMERHGLDADDLSEDGYCPGCGRDMSPDSRPDP